MKRLALFTAFIAAIFFCGNTSAQATAKKTITQKEQALTKEGKSKVAKDAKCTEKKIAKDAKCTEKKAIKETKKLTKKATPAIPASTKK